MAVYKVLQDIEAEDKLIGPLTLRQFIYAGIAAVCLYITYLMFSSGVGFLSILTLPIAVVAGFFAFPWGRDQPTEIWALAKIRYMLKPRRRIWNQSGVKELVTITAPKSVEVHYTNGLSETEVRSRLRALADTIDSRGWVIKNANVNLYAQSPTVPAGQTSDRLIGPASLPQPVDSLDIQASDDMLDEVNNANAHRLETMINQSAKTHRDRIVESLQDSTPPTPVQSPQPMQAKPSNYWFLNQPAPSAAVPDNMVTFNTQVVTPGASVAGPVSAAAKTAEEAKIMAELEAHKQPQGASPYGNLHQILPLSATPQAAQPVSGAAQTFQPTTTTPQITDNTPPPPPPVYVPTLPTVAAQSTPSAAAQPPVTPASQAAILQLSTNNDLNVATIAREAERSAQNEVVIKLH